MSLKEKFKCEYCPSILSTKFNRESHLKRNKACLKSRGLTTLVILTSKTCYKCGFICSANSSLSGHTCRTEHIDLVNINNKLNNDTKCNKLDHDNIISDKNNKINELENKINTYESIIEIRNNEIKNLERDFIVTIDELKARNEKYENKIFDIASKPNSNIINNNSTTNTNNIHMLIQKLVPVTENEIIQLFENVVTKEIMLNGVDSLMEGLGSAMKVNHMLCTDTTRNKLTYKDDANKVIKDTNGKVILPQLCKLGQQRVDKGYLEAEKIIKSRTTTDDEYDCQMKYLNNEWQYKYLRIKSGLGDKETKRASHILSEKVKVQE